MSSLGYSQMYELKPVPFSPVTKISEDDSYMILIEEKDITISFAETHIKLKIEHIIKGEKETIYNCKDSDGVSSTIKIYDTQGIYSDFYFYSSKISYKGCLILIWENDNQ